MSKARTLFAVLIAACVTAVPTSAQEFGGQIILSGDQLLISESVDPAGVTPDGTPRTVYVYSRSGSGWEETGAIRAPAHEGPDYFGRFLIQDGDKLLAGATALDQNADGQSDGNVLIYGRSGDGWEFESYLRPESVPLGSSYGRFASIGGDLLVVTALGYRDTGGAWVFERGPDGGWIEQAILTPAEPDSAQEFFGWGAHTDGERVIVGAFNGPQLPGAAYIFGRDSDGTWVQEAKLQLDGPQQGAVAGGSGA
ncbi:MAG: hypothetical protein MJB57_13755, partial [Gemmatimonadetes bacterium]|nr:hypothetical protein [Gemmatimonadota bacterium]